MSDKELKPCPFCGSEVPTVENGGGCPVFDCPGEGWFLAEKWNTRLPRLAQGETPASKLVLTDRDGAKPVAEIRLLFEQLIRETSYFNSQPMEIADDEIAFTYTNAETHLLWFGFALGVRCAERIEVSLQQTPS